VATTYTPVKSGISYRPAGTDNGQQNYNVFYPGNRLPNQRLRCLAYINCSGFTVSDEITQITSISPLHQLLETGWVIVTARCSTTGLPAAVGGGMFLRPAHPDFDREGGGFDCPNLDAEWLMQDLRLNASSLGIDPDYIIVGGDSGGSHPAVWAALAPEARDPNSAFPMLRQSSRANGLFLTAHQGYPAAFCTTSAGGGPNWWQFRSIADNEVSTGELDGSVAGDIVAGSPMTIAAHPDAEARNQYVPIFIHAGPDGDELASPYAIVPPAVSFALDANRYPTFAGTTTTGFTTLAGHHPALAAYLVKALRDMHPWYVRGVRWHTEEDYDIDGLEPDEVGTLPEALAAMTVHMDEYVKSAERVPKAGRRPVTQLEDNLSIKGGVDNVYRTAVVRTDRAAGKRGAATAHFSAGVGAVTGSIKVLGRLRPDLEFAEVYDGGSLVEIDCTAVATPNFAVGALNVPVLPEMVLDTADLQPTNNGTVDLFILE